jgi:hypothetical protein
MGSSEAGKGVFGTPKSLLSWVRAERVRAEASRAPARRALIDVRATFIVKMNKPEIFPTATQFGIGFFGVEITGK